MVNKNKKSFKDLLRDTVMILSHKKIGHKRFARKRLFHSGYEIYTISNPYYDYDYNRSETGDITHLDYIDTYNELEEAIKKQRM